MQNKRQLAEAKSKMKTDSKKRKADKAFAEGRGNWESDCGCVLNPRCQRQLLVHPGCANCMHSLITVLRCQHAGLTTCLVSACKPSCDDQPDVRGLTFEWSAVHCRFLSDFRLV